MSCPFDELVEAYLIDPDGNPRTREEAVKLARACAEAIDRRSHPGIKIVGPRE